MLVTWLKNDTWFYPALPLNGMTEHLAAMWVRSRLGTALWGGEKVSGLDGGPISPCGVSGGEGGARKPFRHSPLTHTLLSDLAGTLGSLIPRGRQPVV